MSKSRWGTSSTWNGDVRVRHPVVDVDTFGTTCHGDGTHAGVRSQRAGAGVGGGSQDRRGRRDGEGGQDNGRAGGDPHGGLEMCGGCESSTRASVKATSGRSRQEIVVAERREADWGSRTRRMLFIRTGEAGRCGGRSSAAPGGRKAESGRADSVVRVRGRGALQNVVKSGQCDDGGGRRYRQRRLNGGLCAVSLELRRRHNGARRCHSRELRVGHGHRSGACGVCDRPATLGKRTTASRGTVAWTRERGTGLQ